MQPFVLQVIETKQVTVIIIHYVATISKILSKIIPLFPSFRSENSLFSIGGNNRHDPDFDFAFNVIAEIDTHRV